MTRLFLSLYGTLTVTFIIFVFTAHWINTFLILDIDNVIEAKNFQAEIQMLEQLTPFITEQQKKQHLRKIAELNQIIIEPVMHEHIPDFVAEELKQQQVWVDDNDLAYFSAFVPKQYFSMRENDEHKLVQVDVMIEKTILLMMFTLIGVITFIWMKLLGNKLRHLERATEKFGAGDFSIRAPSSFRHSVGNLNLGFNQMASKIEKLLLSHKQLSHNIAHELRTPIFKIQMQLELLEANSNAKQQKYITGIEDDLFYLQDLVDELLQYAQAERAELKIKRSNFKVNTLINSVIDNLSATTNQNINFKSTQDNDLSISADINLVARIISNLLSNAIKYGLDLIEISVESCDKKLFIHIDDNGNGVGKNNIESIFEPFYQVDSSHNGYGLGLSLAREIAKLHNGNIKYQKSPLSGARFTLALPMENNKF